jgi:hypothetical protein
VAVTLQIESIFVFALIKCIHDASVLHECRRSRVAEEPIRGNTEMIAFEPKSLRRLASMLGL